MPKSKEGILITCDVPLKTFLVHLNSKQQVPFILFDIDDTHLFMEADRLAWLNEQIEEWHGKNTFKDDGKEENSYLSAQ